MKKLNYVLSGITTVAVIALVLVTMPKDRATIDLLGGQEITHNGSRAFGSLENATNSGGRGQGGGGNASALPEMNSTVSAPTAAPDMGMGGGGDAKLIAPPYYPTYYKFVYTGEDFTVEESSMEVYERQKGFGSSVNLQSLLGNFNISLFNINKFNNANVDYINASEDRDEGYMVSVDLKQGSIYISQNWERWTYPAEGYQPLTPDQVPADEVVINIANQFLDEYGIERSSYGEPYVQDNNWRILYEKAADKSQVWVPDTLSVVYPTRINGEDIYDESGNKTGLYVSVNVRNNRVTGVGELRGERYAASSYETEQDMATLVKYAETGFGRGYLPPIAEPNAVTQEIELGTPTRGLVRMWLYSSNQSRELYVPGLIFPITKGSDTYWAKNVTVPLIKDVLNFQPDGGGYPMPLERSFRAE